MVGGLRKPSTGGCEGQIRISNVLYHLDTAFGGTSQSVPSLCHAVSKHPRYSNSLIAIVSARESVFAEIVSSMPLDLFRQESVRLLSDLKLMRGLKRRFLGQDIVHIHGLWQQHCSAASFAARSLRKPYIVSLHGMLSGWALSVKKLRKKLYLSLWEKHNLARAFCLRALTRAEAEDARKVVKEVPICIVPNGVELVQRVSEAEFRKAFPTLGDRRLILFMGRILSSKGVDLLCRAWADVCPEFPDHHLFVAGPDFFNARKELENTVRELGIDNRTTLSGMVNGQLKLSLLSSSEIFVLPSESEGFSVAILEALASGLPIIITPQCNFPDVESHQCGLVVERSVSALCHALRDLCAMDRDRLALMGSRGTKLVREKYSWDRIGHQMAGVYSWMLGDAVPADVEIV